MAERLAAGNAAIALLANTAATVGGLYVLIEVFAPISGAHFNPAVSIAMAFRGELATRPAGRLHRRPAGRRPARRMARPCDVRDRHRAVLGQGAHRPGQWLAEAVATFGLLLVVLRAPSARVAALVASYIGAAYWFTASTSFANPAAAFGRMFSDSFAGIAPASVPGFVVAELVGAGLAVLVGQGAGVVVIKSLSHGIRREPGRRVR